MGVLFDWSLFKKVGNFRVYAGFILMDSYKFLLLGVNVVIASWFAEIIGISAFVGLI